MATRTRRDAGLLPEWDDTLLWYAKAVAEMLKRPINDPTSFRYQAAIHEYRRAKDPYANPADHLPSTADQRKFWTQCQHNSWYFLPWHRWYLWYYESIIADTVVKLGGPADWSLPYWNYSRDDYATDARRLPKAFTDPTLPDGSPNALHVVKRVHGNNGAPVGTVADVNVDCLDETQFEADAQNIGFGGPKTGFNHGGGDFGALETTPHGNMHVAVGGWMAQFYTAGLDPIFWCHHANVDRLWVVWRKLDAQNVDPADPDWGKMAFDFHDKNKAPVQKKVKDAVDTTVLGYKYEDTSDPRAAVAAAAAAAEAAPPRRMSMAQKPVSEMIGASEGPVPLGMAPTATTVALTQPSGPAAEAAAPPAVAAGERKKKVFIRIENVTGEGHPRRYQVFVNDVFAGTIPLFGVEEATHPTESHPGGGLHYRIDATEVVRKLQAEGKWDPANVRVSFAPVEEEEAPAVGLAAEAAAAPEAAEGRFQVGRVSVHVA